MTCELCGAPGTYRSQTDGHMYCSADCQYAAPSSDTPVWDPLIKAPPTDPTTPPF